MTRFETSPDGIKSTTSKIADVEGVLIEEVLSEPEQEAEIRKGDVVIEEVREDGEKYFSVILFNLNFFNARVYNKNSCINIVPTI